MFLCIIQVCCRSTMIIIKGPGSPASSSGWKQRFVANPRIAFRPRRHSPGGGVGDADIMFIRRFNLRSGRGIYSADTDSTCLKSVFPQYRTEKLKLRH